jgi:CheY-like chemotaxis protein
MDPRLEVIPVVVMSGLSGIDRRAKAAGATVVMQKPIVPQFLLEIIEHFVAAG